MSAGALHISANETNLFIYGAAEAPTANAAAAKIVDFMLPDFWLLKIGRIADCNNLGIWISEAGKSNEAYRDMSK